MQNIPSDHYTRFAQTAGTTIPNTGMWLDPVMAWVSCSAQLGRLCVTLPLRVNVSETHDKDGKTAYVATLEPGEMTCHEYGYGATVEAALEDLASTVWEIRQQLINESDEKLGADLLAYKRALLKYTQVNTTHVEA